LRVRERESPDLCERVCHLVFVSLRPVPLRERERERERAREGGRDGEREREREMDRERERVRERERELFYSGSTFERD